jgi:methyl-accepting chemotaxis protein
MTEGDLTHRMSGEYRGLFGTLAENLDKCLETLSKLVSEISEQTEPNLDGVPKSRLPPSRRRCRQGVRSGRL